MEIEVVVDAKDYLAGKTILKLIIEAKHGRNGE